VLPCARAAASRYADDGRRYIDLRAVAYSSASRAVLPRRRSGRVRSASHPKNAAAPGTFRSGAPNPAGRRDDERVGSEPCSDPYVRAAAAAPQPGQDASTGAHAHAATAPRSGGNGHRVPPTVRHTTHATSSFDVGSFDVGSFEVGSGAAGAARGATASARNTAPGKRPQRIRKREDSRTSVDGTSDVAGVEDSRRRHGERPDVGIRKQRAPGNRSLEAAPERLAVGAPGNSSWKQLLEGLWKRPLEICGADFLTGSKQVGCALDRWVDV